MPASEAWVRASTSGTLAFLRWGVFASPDCPGETTDGCWFIFSPAHVAASCLWHRPLWGGSYLRCMTSPTNVHARHVACCVILHACESTLPRSLGDHSLSCLFSVIGIYREAGGGMHLAGRWRNTAAGWTGRLVVSHLALQGM